MSWHRNCSVEVFSEDHRIECNTNVFAVPDEVRHYDSEGKLVFTDYPRKRLEQVLGCQTNWLGPWMNGCSKAVRDRFLSCGRTYATRYPDWK